MRWTEPNVRRASYLVDEQENIHAQVLFECFTDKGEMWSAFLPLDHPENYRKSLSEQEAKEWAQAQVEKLEGKS